MISLARLIFTPIGFVVFGLIAIGVGVNMVIDGRGKVPERSDLTKVTGTILNITKKWKQKKTSIIASESDYSDVRYELEIAAGNAPGIKLIVTEEQIRKPLREQVNALEKAPGRTYSEREMDALAAEAFSRGSGAGTDKRIAALHGAPVVALVRSEDASSIWASNIWELTAGKVTLIEYANKHDEHARYLAAKAEDGPHVAGAGVIVVLAGAFWFSRWRARA